MARVTEMRSRKTEIKGEVGGRGVREGTERDAMKDDFSSNAGKSRPVDSFRRRKLGERNVPATTGK